MTQRNAHEELNGLTESVIGAAIQVHRALGPGLLENVYSEGLAIELADRDLPARREVVIPLQYKNTTIENAYRLDFIVENTLIVECKTIKQVLPMHSA